MKTEKTALTMEEMKEVIESITEGILSTVIFTL